MTFMPPMVVSRDALWYDKEKRKDFGDMTQLFGGMNNWARVPERSGKAS